MNLNKKIRFVLLTLLVVIFSMNVISVFAQSDEREARFAIANADANVRSQPSTNGTVIDRLDRGERAEILSERTDGQNINDLTLWYEIQLPNQTGWVWAGVMDEPYDCVLRPDETGYAERLQDFYPHRSTGPNGDPLFGVIFDEYDEEPREYHDRNGDVLFTALLSLRVLYLDRCDNVDDFVIPYIVHTLTYTAPVFVDDPENLFWKYIYLERGDEITITLDPDRHYGWMSGILRNSPNSVGDFRWFETYLEQYYQNPIHQQQLERIKNSELYDIDYMVGIPRLFNQSVNRDHPDAIQVRDYIYHALRALDFEQVPDEGLIYTEDFEDGVADNWNVLNLHPDYDVWHDMQIIDDGTGNMVWRTKERAELEFAPSGLWSDYSITLRFRVMDWEQGNLGIKLRYDNRRGGYYFANISRTYVNLLSHASDENWINLVDTNVRLATDEWHSILVEVSGNQLSYQINDRPIENAVNRAYSSGNIRLLVWEVGEVWFDDIEIVVER